MVVDFDNPSKRRKINCNIKWEPSSLEWNPHQLREKRFATVVIINLNLFIIRFFL